jgi:tetratricopeptide (TPR) repeat protein
MDMSALQKAIPVAPKPTKQRTLEVKCPMCETMGYVAPQHQGKDVKCANPDCKHPYFVVPLPKKDSGESGLKKKKGLSIAQVLTLVVAGLGLAGTAIWWFVVRIPPVDPSTQPTIKPTTPIVQDDVKPKDKEPVAPKRISIDEIRQGAITELTRISNTNDANQGLAVRYLAEAYAASGQMDKATAELQRLGQKAPDAPYLQVEPLVRLYLQARKAGAADAGKYLDEALKKAVNLPPTGRRPLDAANALAAALVLADRMPEGHKLIHAPAPGVDRPQGEQGNRADYSMLWTAAVYGNSFDFQKLSEIPAWLAAPNPQHAAVTWVLCSWGEPDKALAWVKNAGTVEAVDASLAVWAAHLGLSAKSTSEGVIKLEAAIKDATPAGQSRAWSNFAYQRASGGDAAGAKELMAKADAALQSLPPATLVAMPTVKEIHDSDAITNIRLKSRVGLPDAGPQRSAALAYANLAVLHLKLGDKAPVESLIGKGLDYAEAIAPPAPPVMALAERLEKDSRGLEAELDRELNLKGNKQKSFPALTRFRGQLKHLEEISTQRVQFERELIRDIAYRGEPALAWAIVQKRDQLEPAERRPMLSATPLTFYIAVTAVAIGDKATGDAAGKFARRDDKSGDDKIDLAINSIVFNMKDGKFASAIDQLKTIYRAGTFDRDRVDIAILRRISQYHTLKKTPERVFDLIRELPDPQVQEAAMYLMSARAVVEDKGPELYKLTSPDRMQRTLSYAERAALARGYVAGAEAVQKTQEAPKVTTK